MTIIEAIRSGKMFKRPLQTYWMENVDNKIMIGIPNHCTKRYFFCADDILADDWEVKEEDDAKMKPCPFCGGDWEFRNSLIGR